MIKPFPVKYIAIEKEPGLFNYIFLEPVYVDNSNYLSLALSLNGRQLHRIEQQIKTRKVNPKLN